ncbi:cytochrome c oxidase subunit II [Parendozoicomonas haliclonae]|uniref:Cytochrome c oxidase subunit 2 n=1 Tax=Parendozoicomonas haliclonae TaxID=1960125 RepID=A0A1X7ALQ8_9GAMM|nr:cytochrome c oxidase subunit II [Parendozoicomonas haliclonae]SMA46285.1 Cytochrome c oxidase subunit 2 precursor [Parendozoicomonas haliclonae]
MRLQARKLLTLMAGLLASPALWAEWAVNMPEGVTDLSRSIYDLHMTIFWICVVIGIVVFGVMFWSVIFHRKSRGAKASEFHESTLVEILWTSIPFAILVVMAIPATKTLIEVYDTKEADIDIKVTGYQWKWQYEYLGEDVSFFSNLTTPREEINNQRPKNKDYLLEVDEPLVVPIGKKIRFLVTGADVIHSWWVPELAVKKDAIPGFINESWAKINEPGIYRGQCAELCGKDHGFMPIVVDARPMDEYQKWLDEKRAEAAKVRELTQKDWTMDELMEKGEQVYTKLCAACHQPNGMGLPPMFPALKDAPIAVERSQIGKHIDVLLYGVKGTAMQAFKEQLNEVDMAAVITYERNAWGNNTGEVVTPKDILEYKKNGAYTGKYVEAK